jgi:hypothetical protein
MTMYHGPGDGEPEAGVRASLATCVSDVRMPADLLDRAAARNRARTTRNRLIGAAGTAAAGVAATLLVSMPGPPTTARKTGPAPAVTAPRVQTAAYILQRAATAEVNSYHMISVSRSPGSGTTYTDISTQQQRIVAGLRDSTGQPYFQIVDAIKDNVWTDTVIDNQDRVYSVQSASTTSSGIAQGLTISSFLPLQTQSDPAAAFRAALKNGTITVVGYQKLDGRATILLRVKRLTKKQRAGAGYPAETRPVPDNEIWIDASSYLLVQTKSYKSADAAFVTQVSWLPATSGNLAKLTATPPSTYTRVPYSQVAKYLAPIS